ncbi:O-antigen polymerase [Mucilaginibacter sp. Mucisp86]|uniref:O-antigen polymerase n=1 Tax=Mucilaginibacter sp. Mucisp86 TaxID=3243060 RepID=UPI0039B37EAE
MFEFKKYIKLIDIAFYVVLGFLLLNFKFTGGFYFILSEVVFIVYLLFILQILRSGLFKYVYEPPIFFLFFSFIYEFLKFPYYFGYTSIGKLVDASLLGASKFRISDYYANSAFLLLYQAICIAVLLICYFLVVKRKSKVPVIKKVSITKDTFLVAICAIFLVGSTVALYSITGGNLLFLLTRRSGNEEASKILQSNYLVAFSTAFVLIIVPVLIGFRVFSNRPWKKLLFIYLPAIILEYIISGGRGFIIYSLAALFTIFSSKPGFSISITKIAMVGGSAIMLFSILGLVRRSFSDTSNILNNIKDQSEVEDEWYYELSGYQLQFRDEMVFENASKAGFLLGDSYLNLVTFAFPKSLLGDAKPDFIDLDVVRNFWGRDDVGLPLNSMTESYYNFSFFGILIFLLFGFVMARITQWLANNQSVVYKCIVVVLLFYAETWSTTYLVYVLQTLIVVYFPLKFVKEKLEKQDTNKSAPEGSLVFDNS